jgi:hypothetical protein
VYRKALKTKIIPNCSPELPVRHHSLPVILLYFKTAVQEANFVSFKCRRTQPTTLSTNFTLITKRYPVLPLFTAVIVALAWFMCWKQLWGGGGGQGLKFWPLPPNAAQLQLAQRERLRQRKLNGVYANFTLPSYIYISLPLFPNLFVTRNEGNPNLTHLIPFLPLSSSCLWMNSLRVLRREEKRQEGTRDEVRVLRKMKMFYSSVVCRVLSVRQYLYTWLDGFVSINFSSDNYRPPFCDEDDETLLPSVR